MIQWILSVVFIIGALAHGEDLDSPYQKKLRDLQVQKIVGQYRQKASMSAHDPFGHRNSRHCSDEKISCVEATCKHLDAHKCDDLSELKKVGALCVGQINGECIDQSCQQVGDFRCDDLSEIEPIAAACKANVSGTCVKEACALMGEFRCDNSSEIQRVAKACQGVPEGCVKSTCGFLDSHECDSMSEIEGVTEVCKGQL